MSLSSDTSEPSETDDDEPIMDKQKRRKERTEAKHEVRQTKGANRSKRAPTQATETALQHPKENKIQKIV
jgi:hypothetical protein